MARVAMFVMLVVIGQNCLMGITIGRKKVDVIHKGKPLQDLVMLDSRVAPHDLDNLNTFVKPKLLEDSRDEGMMLQENGIEDFRPLDVSLETDEGPYEGEKHHKEMDQMSVSDSGNNDEGYNLRDMPEYNLETKADFKGNQEAIDWLMKDPNDYNVKSFEDSNALEDTDNFDSHRDSTDMEDQHETNLHQRIKGSTRHQDTSGKVTINLKHVNNPQSVQDYDQSEDNTQFLSNDIDTETRRHRAKTRELTDKYNDFQDSEYSENDNMDKGQKSWNGITNDVDDDTTDRSFDEYDNDNEVSSRTSLQKRIENQDTKLYKELENYAKIDNYDYSDYLDNFDFHGNDFKNAGSKYEDMTDREKEFKSDEEDDISWSNDENYDPYPKEDSRGRNYEWNRDDSSHPDDQADTEKLEDTNDDENSDASGSMSDNKENNSVHETDDKSKENTSAESINSDEQVKNIKNSHANDDSKLQRIKGEGTYNNGNNPVIQNTHSLASEVNHEGKSQEEKVVNMGQGTQAVTYNEKDMLTNNKISHQATIISNNSNVNHNQSYNPGKEKITSTFLKPGTLWIPGKSEIKGIQHSNLDEHVVSLSVPKAIEEIKKGTETEKTHEESPTPTEKPKSKANDKQWLILQKVKDLLKYIENSPHAQINAALKKPIPSENILKLPHHNSRAQTHRKSNKPTSTGFRRNQPSYLPLPGSSYSLADLTKMERIISFLRGTTSSRSVPTRPSKPTNVSLQSLYYYPIHPTPQNDGTSDVKDATFSEWNDWSTCSVTCGKGASVRARVCLVDICPQNGLFQTKSCHEAICADEVERESLEEHNKLRAKHFSPPLSWSSSLARKAQTIAQSLAGKDFLTLDDLQERQGESIAQILYTGESTAITAIEKWYKEIESYSFSYPKINSKTRHFVQIAWKGTKEMGLAVTRSSSGEYAFVVALYNPPVSSDSHLRQNILPPGHKHDLYSTFRRRKSLG